MLGSPLRRISLFAVSGVESLGVRLRNDRVAARKQRRSRPFVVRSRLYEQLRSRPKSRPQPTGLTSLLALAERYDVFLLDQFGVIHDGKNAYEGAVALHLLAGGLEARRA